MIAKHGSFSVATRRVRYCGTRPPPLMRPRPPGAAVALREKREKTKALQDELRSLQKGYHILVQINPC